MNEIEFYGERQRKRRTQYVYSGCWWVNAKMPFSPSISISNTVSSGRWNKKNPSKSPCSIVTLCGCYLSTSVTHLSCETISIRSNMYVEKCILHYYCHVIFWKCWIFPSMGISRSHDDILRNMLNAFCCSCHPTAMILRKYSFRFSAHSTHPYVLRSREKVASWPSI